FEVFGDRLFEIDVLAGGKGGAGPVGTAAGRGGVEIDLGRRIGEARVAIGAPFEAAALFGERSEFLRIAPEQYRLGHQPVAIGQRQPAFAADRQQCSQMLRRPETASRAVDDDANFTFRHWSPKSMFTTETQRA